MSIEIRAIDVHDEAQLHEWWATGRDAASDRAYDVYPAWEHSRVALPEESPEHDLTLLAAHDGGAMVGIGLVELPLLDNTHISYVDVGVPPAQRGHGVGAALLGRIEQLARDAGRTHAIAAAFTPPGGTSAGARFAAAHGYEVANTEGWKVLDLRDLPDWGPLDERVVERIGDYRVVEWETFTPEEHVADLTRALSTFVSMVPTGELAIEDGEWTPERYLDNERRERRAQPAVRRGRDRPRRHARRLHRRARCRGPRRRRGRSASPSCCPDIAVTRSASAIKLANHRALMAALPECEIVRTSNADVNDHMNAVNEAMGYRQVEDILEVQKTLTPAG